MRPNLQRRIKEMKKFMGVLAAALFALPIMAQTSYTSQSGVSLFSGVPATATQAGTSRLPNFSGTGVLTITESGITGSPSGCTVTLKYKGNNTATAGAVVSTTSFTPSTGVQTFTVLPTALTGDNYVATYACTTYPTAGAITASFSPVATVSADPCFTSPKSSAVVNAGAATVQLVPLAAGKAVYVCGGTVVPTGTVALEYGTGTLCATGLTALTGTMVPTSGSIVTLNGEGTRFVAPAGTALCLVSGTTAQGVVSYVQQ
jgi:hypothetical protein